MIIINDLILIELNEVMINLCFFIFFLFSILKKFSQQFQHFLNFNIIKMESNEEDNIVKNFGI